MAFSIRLTDDERMLAESNAKLHSYSLSEAFKRALFERIEDAYDLVIGEEAYCNILRIERRAVQSLNSGRNAIYEL